MIHKNRKLHRSERILYLREALNRIKNLRRTAFMDETAGMNRDMYKIGYLSSEKKPFYSWWTIFWDLVIGLNVRK